MQSILRAIWIASSWSLSSGAHSRDPLAPRNDEIIRATVWIEAYSNFQTAETFRTVIASEAKQSIAAQRKNGLLRRGACHRARIRATRWLLAMTARREPAVSPRDAHHFRRSRLGGHASLCPPGVFGCEVYHPSSTILPRDLPDSSRACARFRLAALIVPKV